MTEKRTLKAFFWSFLEQGGSRAISLVVQVILARILAPEAFGVLAILVVVIELANVLAISGLGTALIQDEHATERAYTTAFWLSTFIAFILYLVLFVVAPLFASFYAMPDLTTYLRVLSIVVFFNGFNSIQRSYLQKNLDFKSLFSASILATMISGALSVCGALVGLGIWALIVQSLLYSACECLVMMRYVPWKPSFCFSISDARRLYAYGWKICATGLLGSVYASLSELIIGKVCTVDGLAYYSQGRKWPNVAMSMISGALQNVMFPALAALKKDMDAFRAAIRRMLDVGHFIVIPLAILAAVIAQPFVIVVLTEKWLPCVFVFQITALSNCVLMLQLVNLRAYMALGASDLYLKLQVIKIIFGTVAVCGVAIITNDINVIALSTCLVAFVDVLAMDMLPAKRMFGLGWVQQMRSFLPVLLVAGIAGVVAYMVVLARFAPVIQMLLQVLVFFVVYLGLSCAVTLRGWSECWKMVKGLKDGKRSVPSEGVEDE